MKRSLQFGCGLTALAEWIKLIPPANELMRNMIRGVDNRPQSLYSNIKSAFGHSRHLWIAGAAEFECQK